MSSMNKIEWFEDDGVQGGQRGLTVDFTNNKIIKWNGIEESISESNIDDIRWCIDMNLKYLSQRYDKITKKLKQTKTVYTKIEGGYKMSEVLTETQREKYEKLVDEINSETMEYVNLKEKYK